MGVGERTSETEGIDRHRYRVDSLDDLQGKEGKVFLSRQSSAVYLGASLFSNFKGGMSLEEMSHGFLFRENDAEICIGRIKGKDITTFNGAIIIDSKNTIISYFRGLGNIPKDPLYDVHDRYLRERGI